MGKLTDQVFFRRALARWDTVRARSQSVDLEELRGIRKRARTLRRRLDQVLHIADGRLALPLIGSSAIKKPLHSDWAWRPELWRGPVFPKGYAAIPSKTKIGEEIRVYHDCQISELTLRQLRNTRDTDLAPFGLQMDVFRFDGSFLSLVIDLPDSAVDGLKARHLVRLSCVIEMEKPLEIFARFNFKHGPNSEQIVRELDVKDGQVSVDFDLAYTNLNEKRLERAWVDLIFERPQMSQVILRDVTFSRRPRAEV